MLKLFASKPAKKPGIGSLNRDQMDRERIRLEHQEKKLTREIEALEQQKEAIFKEGTASSVSDRQRLALARKLKKVEDSIQGLDKQLALLARNQHVLNSLLQLADNQQTVSTLGLESVLKGVDLDSVRDLVDNLHAEHEFATQRFQMLSQSMTTYDSVNGSGIDDADTQAIFEAMQKAAHHNDSQAAGTELAQVTQQLRTRNASEITGH